MTVAKRADFIRRVYARYGLLVAFEGQAPATLRHSVGPTETHRQFCLRVRNFNLKILSFID